MRISSNLPWLFQYGLESVRPRRQGAGVTHIMIGMADHFEPFNGGVDDKHAERRVATWIDGYQSMAVRHRDADGKTPQHTIFYPPHHDTRFLKQLASFCKADFGDIELHLHHNRMEPFPDTSATLKMKIMRALDEYAQWGIFCQPDGTRRFAFVHGDWSLDNSRGPEFCGVNDEISILKQCGCYADFTFPSLEKAQARMINRMYYATDDPSRPKSYNSGREVEVNVPASGDLMMVSGILGMRWKSRKNRFRPSIETSNVNAADPLTPERIDYLVRNAVTIQGRPEWRFIKLHTHSAKEDTWEAIWGTLADSAYTYLESHYNDGSRYMLHYVTAREMFNIIKTAESGISCNPGQCRDRVIPARSYL